MRKLFIILVGLIAVVTFIRAFDNFSSFNMDISDEKNSEAFSSSSDLSDHGSGSDNSTVIQ